MKKFIILLLLFASSAFAATEDQEEIIALNSGTGGFTIPFATPPTAGCTMTVAGVFVGDGSDMTFDTPAVVDTDLNTYDITLSSLAGRQIALVAVADNISVTPPFEVSIEIPALQGHYDLVIAKSFCGLANPAKDQTATAADPGPQGSDATVTTATTTQANETVIAAMGVCTYPDASSSNLTITTPTSGYTSIISEQDCSLYQAGDISWKNVTATGAQSASWSHADVAGSGVFEGWVAAMMTLKDAAGGAVARRRSAVVVQ